MTAGKFIPGREWLYLKVYTGVKTSDIILEESVAPLVQYLHNNNYIIKWFFIRYNDPRNHLRLRFELKDKGDYAIVLDAVSNALNPFIDSGEIADVISDTYEREIERYGQNTIVDAENLFCSNSLFTLQCLHYDEEKIMTTLYYIDQILDSLKLSVEEKTAWVKEYNDAFKKEFNADKNLNSQLDRKYRMFKIKYLDFIESEDYSLYRNEIIFTVKESGIILQNIIQNSTVSLPDFFQSIFHMDINRMFISNQRVFEMIIYDYLYRYYKAIAFQKY
ncbi:thiopeptide-type bacteriocin biosynthesis protein [Chryseobacterium sp. H1D6B]|uniref:thiopeptide-type bacteriocin biosynthesis protein n=1 Tax=Chryseobacterium sp. H1D6B TaxID=2940588 RepID=UPI0015C75553|nr:thiopeptide-type bacteriocin biosynthesis protein [Chryseobacterium sp. H1D6B]MDH6252212.1 thiopeptide-type bacteriocin biosynthesis protein [Chryseobacterium sp. H1D6B]